MSFRFYGYHLTYYEEYQWRPAKNIANYASKDFE